MAEERRNVVIVGGGWAGTIVARDLSAKLDASKYNLILVSDKPYFIHLIAGARMTVTAVDKLEDKALVPFDKLFHNGNGSVKIGKVVSVSGRSGEKVGEVVLEDGEHISYAALVLATGSSWPGPLNFPNKESDMRSHLDSWRNRYEKANHVVIVGGGAVGLGAFLARVVSARLACADASLGCRNCRGNQGHLAGKSTQRRQVSRCFLSYVCRRRRSLSYTARDNC